MAGFDTACAQAAAAQGFGGTFEALVSTQSSSGASRFSAAGGPWVRPDGLLWAATATAALQGGPWLAPNALKADGSFGAGVAWTGARSPELLASSGEDCDGWSSSAATVYGYRGISSDADPAQFMGFTMSCDTNWHGVYCLER
jgi:hypothetical protein